MRASAGSGWKQKTKTATQNLAVGAFLLFWLGMVGVFDSLLLLSASRAVNAQLTYRTTAGTITQSGLSTKPVSDHNERRLEVTYAYSVNGQSYTGSRYAFDAFETAGARARRIVREHPVGRDVTIYYAPANPSDAVLHVGPNSTHATIFAFLMPFNVVLAATFATARQIWRGKMYAPGDGIVVCESPTSATYRLQHKSALLAGAAALLLASFAVTGLLTIGFNSDAPPPVAIAALLSLPASFFLAARWRTQQIAAGHFDLHVDRTAQLLRLPRRRGTVGTRVVPLVQVTAVEVNRTDAETPMFPVRILTVSDGPIVIHEFDSEESANEFSEWLRAQLTRN